MHQHQDILGDTCLRGHGWVFVFVTHTHTISFSKSVEFWSLLLTSFTQSKIISPSVHGSLSSLVQARLFSCFNYFFSPYPYLFTSPQPFILMCYRQIRIAFCLLVFLTFTNGIRLQIDHLSLSVNYYNVFKCRFIFI